MLYLSTRLSKILFNDLYTDQLLTLYISYMYNVYKDNNCEVDMNILLSNASQDPIYIQIKKQIKQSILKGAMIEGEPLPSMRKLAKELQISVITTKRAYEELEREGFIISYVGKGSFVAGQNNDLIQERRLQMVEQGLAEIVKESKSLDITLPQLQEILAMLYEEEE